MNHRIARRTFLKTAAFVATALPVAGVVQRAAAAAPLPLIDVNDPTAKALGYILDATKVDAKANPTYKPGQKCGSCVQFQGKPTDKSAACPIFIGKQVYATGWCKVWAQKPGVT